ncbi:MAG: hypothetical protein AB7G11_11095 [Phycisphaerales bacterium]
MQVKTISVTYERKFNLGNYQSANLGTSIWAELDEDDDEAKCLERLRSQARASVRDEYQRLKRASETPAETSQ